MMTLRQKALAQEKRLCLRQEVLGHLSNGTPICKRCGATDIRVLSVDHINGGGGKHLRKIKSDLYCWLKEQNYPPGFQVLCMNCQKIKQNENDEYSHRAKRPAYGKRIASGYGQIEVRGIDLGLYQIAERDAKNRRLSIAEWLNDAIRKEILFQCQPGHYWENLHLRLKILKYFFRRTP